MVKDKNLLAYLDILVKRIKSSFLKSHVSSTEDKIVSLNDYISFFVGVLIFPHFKSLWQH